jgi:predicted AAA+ superfamily ATPase
MDEKIIITRETYIDKIRPFINKDTVKVLTGIRRAGKSTILTLIIDELISKGIKKERIIFINFESEKENKFLNSTELYNYIKDKQKKDKIYLFFDEIQELHNWEKLINSIQIDFNVDIFITGSNANLLSGELATYLGGRYIEFSILPLSYKEVQKFGSEVDIRSYISNGGMPFIYQSRLLDVDARTYLNDIYNSIVLKDIIQRNSIRDIDMFLRILKYIISNIGNIISANSIAKFLKSENRKIAIETIYNYIRYCVNANLIYLVKRENIKTKSLLSFNEKVYLTDIGIKEAFLPTMRKTSIRH